MRTSLVTCTWNRAKQLNYGMLSVITQELPPNEIVVVDDGSQDNTFQVFAELEEKANKKGIEMKYIYLHHPEARISSIPRNIGFKQSTGDVVFFSEPEMLHVGETIRQALEVITRDHTPLATQIWTMGQKIWEKLDEEYFIHPARVLSHEYAMLVSGNMQNTKAPDSDWGITGSNDCFAGCFFGVKRDWFEELGGFDEKMTGHGYEDWDLLHRLSIYGKPVEHRNDIVVIHQWHTKNYPYNIYDHAEKNGTISENRIKEGKFRVNEEGWGKYDNESTNNNI